LTSQFVLAIIITTEGVDDVSTLLNTGEDWDYG